MLFAALPNTDFEAHKALVWYREKLVDDIEARYTFGPVNCCERFEKVILQILFEVRTYLKQIFWRENDGLFIPKLDCFDDSLRKPALYRFNCRCCCCNHIYATILKG